MRITRHSACAFKTILSFVILLIATSVFADPPTRVVRLSQIEGSVSFLPAGINTWVDGLINRPLFIGDSLWNDVDSFSILQLDGTKICLGSDTNLKILNLDQKIAQFQLNQGTMNLFIKRIRKDQEIEIDTPNLAFVIQQPGYYRISVDTQGIATAVTVRQGQGVAYGENASYFIKQNQSVQFRGTDLSEHFPFAPPKIDALENWCNKHVIYQDNAVALKYVADDVIGYDDLDEYGTWQKVKGYGYAWTPNHIDNSWSPYRDGRWLWIDPWGWTWVGEEPWGFTPYHYGRWVAVGQRWYWIPGPRKSRAIYAPALVVFISTRSEDIAWFPLGPGDVYTPPYHVSQEYYLQINISNTSVNQVMVEKSYQNPRQKIKYRNRNQQFAVTAVPINTFRQAQPVNKAVVNISNQQIIDATVSQSTTIVPQAESVLGTKHQTKAKPSEKVSDRTAIAVSKTPPPPISFKEKEELLEKQSGKPLEPETLKQLEEKSEQQNTQVKIVKPIEPITLPASAESKEGEQKSQPTEGVEQHKVEPENKAKQDTQQKATEEPLTQPIEEKQIQDKSSQEAEQQKAAQDAQQKAAQEAELQKAAQDAQQKAAQEAELQKAAQDAQQKAAQEAELQKAAQDAQQKAAIEAEQQKAAQEAQQKAAIEAEQQKAAQEAQQKAAIEAEQQKAAQEAQQKAAQEAEQQRAAQEAEQQRAAQEAQQKAAQEAEQQRAAQEAQQKAAQEAEQQRAAQEAEQQRAAQEAQQKAAQEAEQQRAAQEAQQKAAQEAEQQRAAQEAQQKAAIEAEQQKAAQEAQQKAAAEAQKAAAEKDDKSTPPEQPK